MRDNQGFSLVELMIVVAIIGILSAIAIPNFVGMQQKAKRSEVPTNVDGIKTAELAYEASFNAYIEAPTKPGTPTKNLQAWTVTADGYSIIGWKPDGDVRGSYQVTNVTNTDFLVLGTCDVDGDGNLANYSATANTDVTLEDGDAQVY